MGVVLVKEGVQFTKIAPGGFRILAAIDYAASVGNIDLTITSACDGEHSGPSDPHHRGEAFDVRSKHLTNTFRDEVLARINKQLGEHFFGFLESPDSDNEHFHFQVKKGTTYP